MVKNFSCNLNLNLQKGGSMKHVSNTFLVENGNIKDDLIWAPRALESSGPKSRKEPGDCWYQYAIIALKIPILTLNTVTLYFRENLTCVLLCQLIFVHLSRFCKLYS